MKHTFLSLILAAAALAALSATATRTSTPISKGWKFSLEGDSTAIAPGFADNAWQTVDIPHDWSILMPFDQNAAPGNDGGYLPGGLGWYRNTFSIPVADFGGRYQIYVEGAYMDSEVYVNGHKAGGHPYGYNSYLVDITPYVHGGDNSLVIKVDNSRQKNCRWYSGSGLYRDVKLIHTEPVHIADYGTYITTPDLHTAKIEVALSNATDAATDVDVTATVAGQSETVRVALPARYNKGKAELTINVPDAKPWSPSAPNLYDAVVTVSQDGREIDRSEQKIGFRTISYDARGGLKLNGERILLNGGCIHHDNGILGAAAYPDAEHRRVRLMKEAGFNAVRTSHNPPSEAFLDACDELGLLVIDEAFDGWRDAKNDYDYHTLFDANWQTDIDAMVLRDRNHPSIFCWSIGNEVIERKKLEVVTTARKLAERCRELDPTRPVTSALASWDSDWEIYDPLAAEHDIVGYNYMIHKSDSDHRRVPSRVMMQTESYPRDAWSNYRKVADNSYIIGDFVWTAMDYIGESGIGRHYYKGEVPGEHYERPLFPWHASYCGDIDLIGQRKPISHYRSMLWNPDGEKLFIAVKEPYGYKGEVRTTLWGSWPTSESWNWPGHEGKPIEVEVYSRYPMVRLSLNGEPVGEKETSEMKAVFTLPYAEGTLTAQGIDRDGNVAETTSLSTAGAPYALRLVEEPADGNELRFVGIEVVDKQGRVVPVASSDITVEVTGNGELLALGNADIKDMDPYYDSTHKTWNGRALAVVRSTGKKGHAKLKVNSKGLRPASMTVGSPGV